MEKIPLANGASVSRLGFGCEQLGGFAWGEIDSTQIAAAIHEALDQGVNVLDTADVYGMGQSEERLGEILQGRRADAFIVTKFGVRFDSGKKRFFDNSKTWLDSALDASLRRLQTDYIDLYLLHYWDGQTSWDGIFEALEEKVRTGKIRSYGVSNVMHDLPRTRSPKYVAVETEFSLAQRAHEAMIRSAVSETSLIPFFYGALGQGILSGKYQGAGDFSPGDRRESARYANFHGEKLEKNLQVVKVMREIAGRTGKTLPQIALRWLLDFHPRSVVLTGLKRKEQLRETLGSLGWNLSNSDFSLLESVSAP